MSTVNSYTVYKEYHDLITLLSENSQARIYLAIAKYMFEDKEIKLNEKEYKIFINLKRPLIKSKEQSMRRIKTKPNMNQIETKIKPNKNRKETKRKAKDEPIKNTSNDVDVDVYVNNYINNKESINNEDIYTFVETNFGRPLSPIEYEKISEWENNDLTKYAIKQAILNGKYNLKYIDSILNSYKKNNITTIYQAQENEINFKDRKLNNNPKWLYSDIQEDPATDEEIQKLEHRLNR